MVFSSLTFLFLFLPPVVALYFIVPRRGWRNAVLLIASLVFYAWGEPKYVLLMLAAALVAYLGGLGLAAAPLRARPNARKSLYILILCLLTANLFVFKYLNFTADNLGALTGHDLGVAAVALPIGISFYTFQILSYVIDLYRGRVDVQKNFFRLLLYVSCFPQLIAGPIVRYQTVERALSERRETAEDAAAGARRFILGLSKKVLLANALAEFPDMIYSAWPSIFGSTMYWVAAVAFSLQIYFDFSGYSDMAIGLGRIFGFRFPENFEHPYTARSVTEFWRRWHISLSSWFRDYIYIPLGGNRVSRGRWVFNLLLVWALTGLWHGAQWNFVLWGLYYGLILLLEKCFLQKLLKRLPGAVQWLYTAFCVTLGWVLFDRTDLQQLLKVLRHLFAFSPTDWPRVLVWDGDFLYLFVYLPLGILCMLPLLRRFREKDGAGWTALKNLCSLALLLLCVAALLSSQYNPFIYFRF